MGSSSSQSALHAVDGESRGVAVEIRFRVELDAVEKRLRALIETAMLVSDLLHRFLVDVRAHDFFGHALVVRRALHEAPAAELRQPPLRVLRLWIVAVP